MTQSPSLSVSGHRGAGDIPVRHVFPEDEQGKDMHFCLDFPTLAVVPHGGLGTLTTLLSTSPAQAHLSHKHHSVPSLAYTMTATLVSNSQCSALRLIAKLLLKFKKKLKKKIKSKKVERGLETEQQSSPRAPVQRDTAGVGTGSPPRLHGREATKPSL